MLCLCAAAAACLHICLQQQDMADRGHDGAERDAEDTDELLYTGLSVLLYKQYIYIMYISLSLGSLHPLFSC